MRKEEDEWLLNESTSQSQSQSLSQREESTTMWQNWKITRQLRHIFKERVFVFGMPMAQNYIILAEASSIPKPSV